MRWLLSVGQSHERMSVVGELWLKRTGVPTYQQLFNQGFSLSLMWPVLIAYIGTSLDSFTLLPALSTLFSLESTINVGTAPYHVPVHGQPHVLCSAK